MTAEASETPEVLLGAMRLRPATCEVVHRGRVEFLEPQVMRVLAALAERAGDVVTRDALVARCWDGRAISEDAINRVLSRIRRLAAESGAFDVRTVRKVGYRLTVRGGAALQAQTSGSPVPAPASRRRGVVVGLLLFATLCAILFGVERLRALRPATSARLSVLPMVAVSPQARPLAQQLDSALRVSVSRMRGLEIQGAAAAARAHPTDLVLSGVVVGEPPTARAWLVLTDARSGAQVWNTQVIGADATTLEEQTTTAVVRYLAVWLGDRRGTTPPAREPPNPDALRLVQESRRRQAELGRLRDRNDFAAFQAGVAATNRLAQEALAADSNSVEALKLNHELDTSPRRPRYGEPRDAFEARMARARRHLARALALDPDDPEVLVAAAADYTASFQWDAAERMFQRAIALDPNENKARIWYAYLLAKQGRCAEARHQAQAGAALAEYTWEKQVLPRVLLCDGQRDAARAAYLQLLRADRVNIPLLQDIYLMEIGWRDAAALRRLQTVVRDEIWGGRPPEEVRLALQRVATAADALEGRPAALRARLAEEVRDPAGRTYWRGAAYRASEDVLFVRGLEYATAGEYAAAVAALHNAVAERSLYLPWMLPCGPAEPPEPIRADPNYRRIWAMHPGLVVLVQRRRAALDAPARAACGHP
jgi:DNA-binding winged helix-turn-helix (wHTH) protein/tetratricopeptide (TPR) repeat protein